MCAASKRIVSFWLSGDFGGAVLIALALCFKIQLYRMLKYTFKHVHIIFTTTHMLYKAHWMDRGC